MKYTKIAVVEAHQWHKNGDHPQDYPDITFGEGSREQFVGEGKVVRYFRNPNKPGDSECEHCGLTMHVHGWIDTLEGGHIVCPSDWILTGVKGEHWPVKADIFAETYRPAPDKWPQLFTCPAFDNKTDRLGIEIMNPIYSDFSHMLDDMSGCEGCDLKDDCSGPVEYMLKGDERRLKEEVEILKNQVIFAAAQLSGTKNYENMHPDDILKFVREEAAKI